jgi:hypothetical protein
MAGGGPMTTEWKRGEFTLSTDPARIDLEVAHRFLTTSYWAEGIPREVVRRSIDHALSFGLYQGERMIGLARVITDRATFAYLSDVFVLEAYRGQGLASWMLETIHGHPDLQGLRWWLLATRDAHALYLQAGYTALESPETLMERKFKGVYLRAAGS